MTKVQRSLKINPILIDLEKNELINAGHLKLNQQYKWNITPAKDVKQIDQIKPQIIFIDETQPK